MNKKLYTFAFAALLASGTASLPAYALKYDLSTGFKEPTEGSLKVMLLKNGNTAMLNITPKDGIFIKLFDANKRPLTELTHESDLWESGKMKRADIKSVYEIDGNITVFIQHMLGKTPVLFRLVLDGQTGKMLKEEKIGELHKYSFGDGYAMAFGVPPDNFYIEKDQYSDNYAVVHFMGFESDRNKRIQVVHYNNKHQEISRAYFSSPDDHFKYLNYVGMVVLGDKSVLVSAYGYNTSNSGGKDSRLIISKLDKGSVGFQHKLLEFTDDFKDTRAVLRYNPKSDVVVMLSITRLSTKQKFFGNTASTSYLPLITMIDPHSFSILKAAPLKTPKLDQIALGLQYKNGFQGLPQDIYVNSDNTYTVVMEEMMQQVVYTNNRVTSMSTYLGNAGVAQLDAEGNETAANLIPKAQMVKGMLYEEMYINHRKNSAQHTFAGNQYLSFAYAEGKNTGYIFINDYEKNSESIRKGKVSMVYTVSGTDAFCYVLKNGDFQREYVFGNPSGEKDKRYAMFSVSDYKPEIHTYATIMIEKQGKEKVAKIAWLYLD
jgi:hypothetical protein